MIQALNLILLTASEVRLARAAAGYACTMPELSRKQTADLRVALKTSSARREGAAFFTALYPSWCHSAVAAISLCLLSQVR